MNCVNTGVGTDSASTTFDFWTTDRGYLVLSIKRDVAIHTIAYLETN